MASTPQELSGTQQKRLAEFIEPFRVTPGAKVTLAKDFDPAFKAGVDKKKDGVTLKLFDISDRPLDIRFTSSKSPIPQSEINAFIFSLRPASEEPRKSST